MTPEYRAGRIRRILRIAVCLFSFGFIFPAALMEAEEERRAAIAKIQKVE